MVRLYDPTTMKTLFSGLYLRVMTWSRHKRASWVLGLLSFAESSFFPIPPDVMLAPMSLAQPQRAWWFATLTTVTSVLGGLFGYFIGLVAFQAIEPWLLQSHYAGAFETAKLWFDAYGFWAVLIAGFSPIPYKVFTIAGGVAAMPLLPFVLASIVGRGGRFFLVAGLMKWGGAPMEALLAQWVDRLGWGLVVLVVLVYLSL
jgi:membrane protein YqaA with SNARE-associated domain